MLRQDLKRGLTSWGFWVGMGAYAVFIILLILDAARYNVYATPLSAFTSICYDETNILPVVICVLPLGTAFYDEWTSKNYRMFLPRCGWRRYTCSCIGATAILGALIVGVPIAIGMGTCYMIFPEESYAELGNGFFRGMSNIDDLPFILSWFPGGGEELMNASAEKLAKAERSYSLVRVLFYFVFGACWAQLGLAVSAWLDNWATILVLPLGVFMMFTHLFSAAFVNLFGSSQLVNPISMLLLGYWDYPLWVTCVMPFVWAGIFIALFLWGIRRRKLHE